MKRRVQSLISIKKNGPSDCKVALVGRGWMGSSITACLLAAGYPVIGPGMHAKRQRVQKVYVRASMRRFAKEDFLSLDPDKLIRNLAISASNDQISDAALAIESITENLQCKVGVLQEIETAVTPVTLIRTNTPAIPIVQIRKQMSHPSRLTGMKWDEQAYITIFMEIICGDLTSPNYLQMATEVVRNWGKEETSRVYKAVAGAREDSNARLVKGTSFIPPLNSNQEFRVIADPFEAKYGHFVGAIVNLFTKSGTAQFHGVFYEFLWNSALDARISFNTSAPEGSLKQNHFGAAGGGHVVKDQLFFFSEYQGTRLIFGVTTPLHHVPSQLKRSGNFSDISTVGYNPITSEVRGGPRSTTVNAVLTQRLG